MGAVVVSGAKLACPFGSAPSSLQAASQTSCLICAKPAATVMDTRLGPFGMCSSMANPQVAAATAAALGTLTPQPCLFAPAGVWRIGKPGLIAGGKAVLTSDATIICGMGMGTINITFPGQTNVVTV